MVVALRTVEPPPQEDSHLLSHHVLREGHFSTSAKVMPRRAVITLGRNPLSRYLVIGLVMSNAVAYPFPIKLSRFCVALGVGIGPKKVSKTIGPVIHVLRGFEQDLNQLISLSGVPAG